MSGRNKTWSLPLLQAWLCDALVCAQGNEMKYPGSTSNLQGGETFAADAERNNTDMWVTGGSYLRLKTDFLSSVQRVGFTVL